MVRGTTMGVLLLLASVGLTACGTAHRSVTDILPTTTVARSMSPPTLDGPKKVAAGMPLLLQGITGGAKQGTVEIMNSQHVWKTAGAMHIHGNKFRFQWPTVTDHPKTYLFRAKTAAGYSTSLLTKSRPVTLDAVGDINLGDAAGDNIVAYGPEWPWESVGPVLQQADVAFGNLETAVSRRGTPFVKQFTFRANPLSLPAMHHDGGIDVVNLANNHSGDFGHTALLDTIRYVKQSGMIPVGAGRNLQQALRPRVVTVMGLKIAFVGFCDIYPDEFTATAHRPGFAWATPQNVRRGVHRAARQADIVIATFHWGVERMTTPTTEQVSLAHIALRSGATAVLAGHPHVLQPVVQQGKRLIAYSLGNFVFGASDELTAKTGILRLKLSRAGVVSHRLLPAHIINTRPIMDDRPTK